MFRRCAPILLCAGLFVPAWGQNSTARLTGRVADASGATIPNARITLTNSETGARLECATVESGSCVVSFIRPGVYDVTVEAQGFRRLVRTTTFETGSSIHGGPLGDATRPEPPCSPTCSTAPRRRLNIGTSLVRAACVRSSA